MPAGRASPTEIRALLRAAFEAAVQAVHPSRCIPPVVRAMPPAGGRTIVVGAGKAAAAMADAFSRNYAGEVSGVVVTRHGHVQIRLAGIEVLEAAHPVPDVASVAAAVRVLAALRGLRPADRVIALLSGGGSALLAHPAPGLALADKQEISRQLLAAGATIGEINCVRKKLSAVKGGRLAYAAAPAEVVVLAISDVPGDDVSDIASGPFSADATTLADARAVLRRHGCRPGAAVQRILADESSETPKPGDAAFDRVTTRLCARSADALAAACAVLANAGFEVVLVDDAVNAPAVELARAHARLARDLIASGRTAALVTGGETTVRVRNTAGRGGRNTEYLLTLGLELAGADGAWALAADTDGIDGTGDNAGAVLAPDSLRRAATLGLDGGRLLAGNRSWEFFAGVNDLVMTGPTGTNANDVRIVLVDGRRKQS